MNFLSKSNLSYDDLVMFYSVSFAPDKHEQTNGILLKKIHLPGSNEVNYFQRNAHSISDYHPYSRDIWRLSTLEGGDTVQALYSTAALFKACLRSRAEACEWGFSVESQGFGHNFTGMPWTCCVSGQERETWFLGNNKSVYRTLLECL